jgi:hypothetical protein
MTQDNDFVKDTRDDNFVTHSTPSGGFYWRVCALQCQGCMLCVYLMLQVYSVKQRVTCEAT